MLIVFIFIFITLYFLIVIRESNYFLPSNIQYYRSLTNISESKMSSGGGGEGGPHLRRLREDLQTVVRSSLTPLMEGGSSSGSAGSTGAPSSLATHLAQASTVQTSPTSWQDNITVTVQPQLLPTRAQSHHVLDIEVFQSQQQQQQQLPGAETNNTQQQQQQQTLDVRSYSVFIRPNNFTISA